MQTRSRTRAEPDETPLCRNIERTRVSVTSVEPRVNSHEESLQRRVAELEAQLRTPPQQS